MEIKLPLSVEQLQQLNLPLAYFASTTTPPFSVELSADMGGERATWHGSIVRTEAVIEPRTRTVQVVVEVDHPYRVDQQQKVPLVSGLFVNAKINGQIIRDAVTLPRKALRTNNQVWFVDENQQLQIQKVDVISRANGEVILKGITDKTRIITSAVAIPTVGLHVKAINENKVTLISGDMIKQNEQLQPKEFIKPEQQHSRKLKEKSIGKQLSKGRLADGGL
ncbi:hypothetical protein A9Q98_15850 [Thalassotalea sp. 42_200_T64]|nr:hypothetical protein A9Q98_15850 [Thalassotalea sp. 42_200_T64]